MGVVVVDGMVVVLHFTGAEVVCNPPNFAISPKPSCILGVVATTSSHSGNSSVVDVVAVVVASVPLAIVGVAISVVSFVVVAVVVIDVVVIVVVVNPRNLLLKLGQNQVINR